MASSLRAWQERRERFVPESDGSTAGAIFVSCDGTTVALCSGIPAVEHRTIPLPRTASSRRHGAPLCEQAGHSPAEWSRSAGGDRQSAPDHPCAGSRADRMICRNRPRRTLGAAIGRPIGRRRPALLGRQSSGPRGLEGFGPAMPGVPPSRKHRHPDAELASSAAIVAENPPNRRRTRRLARESRLRPLVDASRLQGYFPRFLTV
jgi:hypothetical protein